MVKAIFLDRDGTIIVEEFYISDPAKVKLLPNAAEGLKRMSALGLGLIVVSNQSGVGRGYFDDACVARINDRMNELLAEHGVKLDGIYYCPHAPEKNCECRKPMPGLIHKAAAVHGFKAQETYVIGDKVCDLELGHAVGAETILVQTGYGAELGDSQRKLARYNVADLLAAAGVIEQQVKSKERREA